MSINATVDGVTYNGITTITTGGKSIALTESGSSGGLKTQSGHIELVGITLYSQPITIQLNDDLKNCTSFCIMLQCTETGTLATTGDPTSEVTMHSSPQCDRSDARILAYAFIYTGVFHELADANVQYPEQTEFSNTFAKDMSDSLSTVLIRASTVSVDSNGLMSITIPSVIVGRNTMYIKDEYVILGV